MMLRLSHIVETALVPLFKALPKLDSIEARVELLAIGLQESGFANRVQIGGPARSFWQFERGGISGVCKHPTSHELMATLCALRGCAFDTAAIYLQIADDDVLAAGLARLLLLTDPAPLPQLDQPQEEWDCYQRNWRPGRPRPEAWPAHHAAAVAEVQSETA